MKELDISALANFSDSGVGRTILLDDPVMRAVLLCLKAGQGLPEQPTGGLVTIYSVEGRVLFWEGQESVELVPGKLIRLTPGRRHRLEAKEDSKLLVTVIRQADASGWIAIAPNGQTIDLRDTPHERRHATVFFAFDQLAAGEWFLLVNDHDPQPLRAQMEQYRPGQLSWEYEVQGPYEFRIKISRVASAAAGVP